MTVRRFKLSPEFLSQFEGKQPNWGFTDEVGNSMGEITFLRSYSRLKEDGTKETWLDACQRVIEGMFSIQREHCRRQKLPWDYKKAQRTAQDAFERMFEFKWLPPGRGLATMGASFVVDEWDGTPLQNCAYVSTKTDFADAMHFLMLASMNGVGVGLDVLGADRHMVKGVDSDNLFEFVIPDSREGWAEALRLLIESYLNETAKPVFDYSLIRPAGSLIARFGGTASGPESLELMLTWIEKLLAGKVGAHLTATDIADIANKIGCCVVSGSSRRSAELLLGPTTDEYLDLKNYEKNPERAAHGWMSNNSIFAEVGQNYHEIAERTRINGEPGYVWMDVTRGFGRLKDRRDDKDYRAAGYNPCAEQSLESWECCTLVETFPTRAESVEDYLKTLKVAYLYAKTVTLLPIVFERSNAVMQRNRRIGLSQTGITTYVETHGIAKWRELCDAGYKEIDRLDDIYSDWLAIRNSIRMTTVKPSGTVSLLTGDSPGTHWNPASGYYIRRVTMGPGILLEQLRSCGYPVEASAYSEGQWVVSFPIKSPFLRSEKDVTIWEKVAMAAEAQHWWSDNSVSVTVSYDPKTEGRHIEHILSLYEGRLKTVSFLPMSEKFAPVPFKSLNKTAYKKFVEDLSKLTVDHPVPEFDNLTEDLYSELVEIRKKFPSTVYAQMPYEEITEEEYLELCGNLLPMLREVVYANGEEALGEKFCTTDKCEMPGVPTDSKAN